MKMSTKTRLMLSAVSAAALAATAAPTYAQDSEDVVVVTGSRIVKQDFISNSPVATVEAIQFERTGVVNTENLLNTLPQTVAGLDSTSNNPGNGTATVDLRGLGANRTLVLVNGRRAQPNGAGGVVDINTIPPALIENVEVLTGGASSVYGADAVAGVVNFILRDDFDGIQANIGYNATEQGDGDTINANLTIGANSADGKGNATFSIGWTDRESVLQGDRDFSNVALFDNGAGDGLEPGGSSGVPGTSIFNGGFVGSASCAVQLGPVDADGDLIPCPEDQLTTTAALFPSTGLVFEADGSARDFVLGGDVNDFYNYAPVNFLQLPQERFTLGGTANYEFNDHAEVYIEGRFAQNTVASQLAPTPIFEGTDFSIDGNPFIDAATQLTISGNNTNTIGIGVRDARVLADPNSAFNPVVNPDLLPGDEGFLAQNLCLNCVFDSNGDGFNDVAPLIDTDGDGIADLGNGLLRRRLVEVGPRFNNDTRNTFQLVTGVRGDLWIDNWTYDVSYSEGRTTNSSFQTGNVNRDRFNQALLLADADGDGNVDLDANGNPSCADTGENGATIACAPLNLFGPGNISDDAAAFLDTAVSTTDETIQRVLQANITGDLGELSLTDSPIGFAIGGEYIENIFEFRPSQDVAASTIAGFNGAPALQGEFDVYSAYGEASIPLLSGLPFAERLTLDVAGRVSDFSTVGTEYNYKVGGEWAVNDQLRFRGNFNTAVRAPNIGELFSPQGENFPGADDPCSASGAPEGGITPELSAACVATGVPLANVGSALLDPAAGQIRSIVGGNPDLEVEEAETITFGAVFTPDFVEGLTVSVDYFDVGIDNAIALFGGGSDNILNVCLTDTEVGGPGSAFCNAINRRADGTIDFVSNQAANVAFTSLKGIDIAAQYNFEAGDIGDFNLNYLGTVTLENEFQAFEGDTIFDCAGLFGNNCGEPDPEYRHRVSGAWIKDSWTTQIVWQLLGSVDDGGIIDGTTQFVDSIGTTHYFDASISKSFGDNLTLTVGSNNVLDEGPPIIGDNDEQANTFPATFDPFGRSFFANARINF